MSDPGELRDRVRTDPRTHVVALAVALALATFAVGLGPAAAVLPEMRPVVYLTVGSAVGLPLLGSLARGVV